MKKCTHFREDGSSCWEYCGPVQRRWWNIWWPKGDLEMAWWLCSRCDASMKALVKQVSR